MQGDAIKENLCKLARACRATEKLLYGDLRNYPSRVLIHPDLEALRMRLLKLSAIVGFDCDELAKILCSTKLQRRDPKPIEIAANALLRARAKVPPMLQNFDGLTTIQNAVNSGDINFFIRLGDHLRNAGLGTTESGSTGGPPAVDNLDEIRWAFRIYWLPAGMTWPGLAYCRGSARIDFITILCQRQELSPPAIKSWRDIKPKNIDNLWRRLGLIPSKHPFISKVTPKTEDSIFSLAFS